MDKNITETTFNQLFVSINFNLFSKIVTELELDKYTKKLTTKRLFLILLYGQLKSVSSLDSLSIDTSTISMALSNCPWADFRSTKQELKYILESFMMERLCLIKLMARKLRILLFF